MAFAESNILLLGNCNNATVLFSVKFLVLLWGRKGTDPFLELLDSYLNIKQTSWSNDKANWEWIRVLNPSFLAEITLYPDVKKDVRFKFLEFLVY